VSCIKFCLNDTLVAKHRVRSGSGRHGAHAARAESTTNFSSASVPTRKRSLSPDLLREAVSNLLLASPKVYLDFLGNVLTCSVTEQRVPDRVAWVTSGWKTPETCGARVVVCRSNTVLANALGNMARELFDVDGVPLPALISQMTPFVNDGATRQTFRDRMTLDLLPFMSAPGVIDDSCNMILIHISSILSEMGLSCVLEQGTLSHLQLVSSFKFAHCQVPMCWDSNGNMTAFVFVMPLQATTAVNYVGEASLDVFGHRKDLSTDLKRGDTVVSLGQSLYLSQERRDTCELVTSVVIAVYSLNSSIPAQHFTQPCFKAANDVAALTGVPPMHVCVRCHVEIRDRATEGLWGNKSVDVGKGFHCSHCRVSLSIPAFVCSDCSTNVGEVALSRVHAWCVHNESSTHDPVGEFVDGWLQWEVSAIQLRAGKVPCFHGSLVQNNLGDALLNVLSLDEIRRAAAMFQQWYLFGNIVYDAAPEELQEFMRESTDYSFLWPKWRELYVTNSHCSRVVLAINAVIGALSIGPLVRGLNQSSGKARKTTKAQPAFYASTEQDNLEDQRSRLWTAARISSGVISTSEMQKMALRTLRHIQKGAWCSNFKCTCNIQSLDVSLSTRWDRHKCRGPALDLTIDQLREPSAITAKIRSTQCRWAEEMTTAEFSIFMSPNAETDHRSW